MYLIPAAGRIVPDPDRGGYLPPEGRECAPHQYWLRRLQDCDVAEGTPPRAADVKATKPTKET